MSTITALSTQMRAKMSDWSDADPEWELFVKDHREFLLAGAKLILIADDEMRKFQYRPEDFLVHKKIDPELRMSWIVLWLNQLTNNLDFVGLTSLYVPEKIQLQRLYEQYRTFKSYLAE